MITAALCSSIDLMIASVMDPSRVEAGFGLRTGPTNLISKTGWYWKSDIEFGLKARTEPGPDSTDKSPVI